jgi:peroxin-2
VNVKAIKHTLRSYLPRLPMLIGGAGAAAFSGQQQQQGQPQSQHQPCGICSTADILEPYFAVPCGHRFCYYCLRSQCLADPQYACPLCLQRIDAMQRGSASKGSGDNGDGIGGNGEGSGGQELSLGSWLAERTVSR